MINNLNRFLINEESEIIIKILLVKEKIMYRLDVVLLILFLWVCRIFLDEYFVSYWELNNVYCD